ncbi:dynein heavy chain and region d6 of dynein motor domain-containing protein [Ditylenchus destructor]|uniref:Dynein heavy chain and region d6 of dynein motor domain-containing protein n=1 Tax=Ditylenchus destructor TaxID=166010 RepID=A0AAD4R0A4_9BILA|nr:dynein heavy chain and region d6 of dynein motor domain-containing protein [Ditylenchus destructor]
MVKQHMKQLDIKRKALQEVTERLQRLSDQFSQMSQKKQELQNQIQACETKVSRSEKLLSALKSEQARWDKNVGDLKKESGTYLQQVMVGSALIEYLGNMDYQHRTRIIQSISPVVGLGRHEFSFRSILEHTSPLWSERKDSSVENYIIVVYSRKVALIVDPQDESLKSLQLMCGSGLVQVDLFSTTLQAVVVATIGMGHPMLIDNVSEPIPLLLAQLIDPKIVVQGGSRYIQLGSKLWHYSTDFRLYLRTERPASSFSKEFLQKVCVVNIALGTRAIQDNLMELFLTVNAFQLTSKKDELIAFKAKTVNEIDVLEEGILEVLSKTKTADLENDRAIEMLAEVNQKSAAMGKANEELVRIEEQLTQLRHRFFGVAEFAARLINVALSLSKLSPFYARTIRYYFDIFTEAVPVDVTNLSEDAIDEINQNVLKAFLWRIGKSLFGEHRKIFEFLACNQFTFKSFSLLSEKKFSTIYSKHVPITQPELNLRQQVFNMDSRLPLIILLSSRSNYVVRMLYSLAEQMPKVKTTQIAEGPANGAQAVPADEGNVVVGHRKVQVIPVEDINQLDCEKCLLDDDWLIVQNCQRPTGDEISALEEVIEKISESLNRKVSFRMFVVMYPEAGVAPHALLDKCNVLTVEEEFTLKNFLLYCYSNLSPAKLHECFVNFYKRDLLYRLCCFHFVLLERSKYGIFGWASSFPITISQFEAAVSLLKDVALAHEKVPFSTILRNALEVAYLGDISIPQDLKVFTTLARWIFQGLSQNDTTPIETIFIRTTIPPMSESVRELIMGSIKFPKDKVLSGLHPYTTAYCKLTKIKKLHHTIRVLLADDTVMKPSEEAGNKAVSKHSVFHEDHKFLIPMEIVSCEDELEARFDYCIQIELRILEELQEHRESESYLKGLLRNRNVDRIILAYFHRPMAIFEVLKLQFAKKHNISYQEVDCHATLKYPGTGVDSIELAECYLLAADYDKDYGCLREPQDQKPFTLLDTVWVVVQRQFGDTPSVVRHASLPLYHKFSSSKLSGGEIEQNIGSNGAAPLKYLPILDVDVETNLPESHWLLRGTKFTTFMPYMD